MAYRRPLTAAEWKKAVETLRHNCVAHLPTGETIIPWVGTYQTTYSLRNDEGGWIINTWDLDRIKKIVL